MAVTRRLLSGSTDGQVIPVAAVATPGTLIHTAVSGAVDFDELYLLASNVTNANARLTVEWGGASDPADHLVKGYLIPPNSPPVIVAPGLTLNNGSVVRAFSDVANAINISGHVNRIAP